MTDALNFYEFFAGGGMVRAGLGPAWRCAFANDLSPKKAAAYCANWGGAELFVGDVRDVAPAMLPGRADLAWGSFPCQDLSLAGLGAGLAGARSGAFWGFWAAILALKREGRAPRTLVLENVCGALTSHGGRDFAAIGSALAGAGYRFGAMVIDAALFLPQSRPRLFILAIADDVESIEGVVCPGSVEPWHPRALLAAHKGLPAEAREAWLWFGSRAPRTNVATLADLVEDEPTGVRWRTDAETETILNLMAPLHRARIEAAAASGARRVGAIYRRMRLAPDGQKVQRAEARFDGLAGCLRTPAGGSSRQTLVVVEDGRVRTRLMSAREAARLMGLDDSYVLPANYNDAYRLAGDGVAVPVVRFLAAELLEPLLHSGGRRAAADGGVTEAPSPERSAIMRAVKARDTKPEMLVRRAAHALGYRFRLHRKDLPGSPDLVFSSRKKVIFVHGCFWHGHDCTRGSRIPKTNADYWRAKIGRNVARDASALEALAACGWGAMVMWECQLKNVGEISRQLREFLGSKGQRLPVGQKIVT